MWGLWEDRDKTVNHTIRASSKTHWKGKKNKAWLDKKTYSVNIMYKIEIRPYYWIVYVQTRTCDLEWNASNSLAFWDTTGHLFPARRLESILI